MGRPVFQNTTGAVLWVGHSAWMVTDREVMLQKKRVKFHKKVLKKRVMVNSGGVAHTCPGDNRASWWVLDQGRRREDESFSVTCQHHAT